MGRGRDWHGDDEVGRLPLPAFGVGAGVALGASDAAAQMLTGESAAADPVTLPDPLTPEAVRELVSRLSDGEVRSLLLERLDAAAEETAAGSDISAIGQITDTLSLTAESIGEAVNRAPGLLDGIGRGFTRFMEPRGWDGVISLILMTLLAIALGLLAEWIVNRATTRWRTRRGTADAQTLGETIVRLIRRGILDSIGLFAFYIVARLAITSLLSGDPPSTQGPRSFPDALIAITFVDTVVLFPRVLLLIARFLTAPFEPDLRLIHTDDWTARFLYRQQTVVYVIWGVMSFMIPFLASHGVDMGTLRLGFWMNGAAYLILFYTSWRARDGLSMMLIGKDGDVTPAERTVARAYPYLCMLVIFLSWLLVETIVALRQFQLLDGRQVWSLLLLLFAPTFDTAIRGMVRHLVKPMQGEGALAEEAYQRTKRCYIRIGRVIVGVAVIICIAEIWDIDLGNLAAASIGARAAGVMIEGIIITLIGYLLWQVISLAINRKLAAEQTSISADGDGGDEGGTGISRLATVLPLLLGTLKVALIVIVSLVVIGNFGIDITPLLAGAGIVGLAIGFGAQKLVADVVSGVFFLIDDAFRGGEYVDIEGTLGTVEKISVRSLRLRHHKGAVHTIPYGEIPKITNYSRDWVIMKLKFTVPFDTDPNKVKKIFKGIGAEMMAIPEYADDFLQPFKSQGVFDFDDIGMIIRGKFMARPGKQFVLRKEIYNRVKAAFEANGIAFARREVRVAIPGLEGRDDLTEEQRDSIATAATAAAQQAEAQDPAKG